MKTRILMIISIAGLVFTGCSLDQKPLTNWTDGAFYETEGQISGLLEGGYIKLENALGAGFMVYGDMRSDLYTYYNQNNVSYLNIMENVITPYNANASWANFYAAIQQANLVIKNAPTMLEDGILDESQFARLMGEAYCLRAYTYFWIVRIWGDAPLVINPSVASDYNSKIRKSTEGELLAQIHSDLGESRKYLSDSGSRTHFTLSASWTISAQVCAWEKDWDGVLEACANVSASTYKLAELYTSDEMVGSLTFKQYIAGSQYASIFNDGKSTESIFELSFSLDDSSDSKLLNGLVYKSEVLRPNKELLAYYKTLKNDDWRYHVNFYDDTKVTKYFIDFDGIATETRNIVLLRYAEIVLLQAEAQLEKAALIGGDDGNALLQQAVAGINTIRKRAGGSSYVLSEIYTMDNIEELRDALAEERKIEFYGEGYRYFDLVRTGKVLEVMEPVNGQDEIGSIKWPVYSTEIVYSNGSIEQNEYYK